MMGHRLIVLGYDWDVYNYAFRDLIDNDKVTYLHTFRPDGLCGVLHRLQFNPKLNRVLPLPFKTMWNPCYLRMLGRDDEAVILVQEHWLRWESATHLLPYIRRNNPKARVVCFIQDLIERTCDIYTGKPLDVDYLKRYSDLVVTYDAGEAERYGISYHPTVYSPVPQKSECKVEDCDVFFLGRDKGRLGLLMDICQKFSSMGLKCQFYVLGTEKENQVAVPGITYLESPMTYEENIQHVAHCSCVLELLQSKASSATFRMWEAIALNKKLLTNNTSVCSSEFYDAAYVSLFTNIEDIDWAFVKKDEASPFAVNPYAEQIRPDALLKFIEKKLDVEIER